MIQSRSNGQWYACPVVYLCIHMVWSKYPVVVMILFYPSFPRICWCCVWTPLVWSVYSYIGLVQLGKLATVFHHHGMYKWSECVWLFIFELCICNYLWHGYFFSEPDTDWTCITANGWSCNIWMSIWCIEHYWHCQGQNHAVNSKEEEENCIW